MFPDIDRPFFIAQRFNAFLEENYPVSQGDVEREIAKAKAATDGNIYLNAATYLWGQVAFETHRVGIGGLPQKLAAIAQLEKDQSEKDKNLSAKDYLWLLLTGELTSASLANSKKDFKEITPHIQKASEVLKMLKNF